MWVCLRKDYSCTVERPCSERCGYIERKPVATVPGVHSVTFMVSDDRVVEDPEGHTEVLAAVVEGALRERFPRLMVQRIEQPPDMDAVLQPDIIDALTTECGRCHGKGTESWQVSRDPADGREDWPCNRCKGKGSITDEQAVERVLAVLRTVEV